MKEKNKNRKIHNLEKEYGCDWREILRKLYVDENLTFVEMHKKLNYSETSLRIWVHHYGLHKRINLINKMLTPTELKKIVELGKDK